MGLKIRWIYQTNHYCKQMIVLTCCLFIADRKWISSISRVTHTVRIVVAYGACGMGATNTRAWVSALVVYTCKMVGTFWVDCALMFALYIGVALQPGQTCARCCTIPFPALGIYTTRAGSAWVNYFWSRSCC